MEELLQAHSKKVITPSYRRIFISKLDVWTTAFRYFHQDSFARHHGLLVVSFACDLHTFKIEPPDYGGPRREFFRRLIKAIFEDSGAFEETPNGFIPKLNTSHLENGVYRTIGKMMSTIMIQGGEPPAHLAPCVVDYILTGDVLQVNATPDDVSASELREMLKKVETSSTERELEDAVKQCDSWRFEVEGLPNPVNMNTKDTFVKKAALFHVILKSQACLDQLIDGLSYYEFSDVCSYTKMLQTFMWSMFYDFLQSVQGKQLEEKFSRRRLTEAEKTFLETLSLVHVVQFTTGASTVPAAGFNPHPQMIFLDCEPTGHPKANTSRNELQIPVDEDLLDPDSDEFDYFFFEALMNSPVCR
ncbi:G2/M phase-specific E3 ubiquitin-protein ligase-like isoform X2 [Erpetoichthys calabaricus]|uniref:G2/M phase-specific E3 ubiquitin-protein ligase-like isoform X2 n=1 Tax=Erpetoichthys calabaricus TaxID=27687 RepID=UPI0022343147|nr:G2/M phase-specific E3 ubiquitin-protein ligase-like isoform X2 [Erpetoichthys calabaricus]